MAHLGPSHRNTGSKVMWCVLHWEQATISISRNAVGGWGGGMGSISLELWGRPGHDTDFCQKFTVAMILFIIVTGSLFRYLTYLLCSQ